jgi:hypothetical protein
MGLEWLHIVSQKTDDDRHPSRVEEDQIRKHQSISPVQLTIDDIERKYNNAGATCSRTYGISSSNPDSIGGNGAVSRGGPGRTVGLPT